MALSLNLHHNLPQGAMCKGRAEQGTASSGLWVQLCLLLLKEPPAINMCKEWEVKGQDVREEGVREEGVRGRGSRA